MLMNIDITHNHLPRLRLYMQTVALALLAATAPLHAQSPATPTADDEVISMTVVASSEPPGKFTLDREAINLAPSPTGSINEALRERSSIQFDQNSRNSMTGGDITPPRISIGGGKYYENNFLIDGVSISNDLNPSGFTASTSDGTGVAPGGEAESIFIDPELIGALTVYTSNVPAEYGSFTGGVISAKIRDPMTNRFHFSLNYRHTQDSWARQHYMPGQNIPGHSSTASYQPEFRKDQYSLSAEGPLSRRISALVSYSENRSVVPIYGTTNRAQKHNNTRINRNLLLKLATYGSENFRAALTTAWTPYEAQYFAQAQRLESNYKAKGGGYSISLNTENISPLGSLENTLSFHHTDQSRTGEGNRIYIWRNAATNNYANWGTSTVAQEGFAGNYTQVKNQYAMKSVFAFSTLGSGWFRNKIKAGGELSVRRQKSDQIGTEIYLWHPAVAVTSPGPLNPDAIGDKENGVIPGEQWMNRRSVYAPYHKNMSAMQAAFFVENVMQLERITLRPGIRLSYDDISNNTDISPRMLATLDVFKNGFLVLSSGASRYFGSQILSYAFHNNTGFRAEGRTSWDQPWTLISPATDSVSRSLGDLKTPYTDEFTAGATATVRKTVFQLQVIKRNLRDQIRSGPDPDGTGSNARKFTNSGSTDYKAMTFEIERRLDLKWAGRHALLFGATWSKTRTSSREDVAFDEGANRISPDYAIYNGELVEKSTMPANNFNNPWVLTLRDTMKFHKNRVRISNVLRYGKGGDGVVYIGFQDTGSPDGLRLYKYQDGHQKDTFIYDLSVEYDLIKYKTCNLALRLEILNVFDTKNLANTTTSSASKTYMMGRQFFAGLRLGF